MKKTTITLLLALSCCRLAAQCPTGDITFSTQGQIDSFPINYPNCSEIDGKVIISGNGIVRLDSLSSLKKIGGELRIGYTTLSDLTGLNNLDSVKGGVSIFENSILVGLVGLENLKYVGISYMGDGLDNYDSWGLNISNNLLLPSLDGLKNLKTVTGCISISSNPLLASLTGLAYLSSIGYCDFCTPCYYASLSIFGNPKLSTLSGLENIHSIKESVSIDSNSSLKSLSGLDNLQIIGGSLSIGRNDSLTTLNGLENLDSLGACLVITSNPALISLDALAGLKFIGRCSGGHQNPWLLVLYENAQLSSINGLNEVGFQTLDRIRIENCPDLSLCETFSICQHINNGGKVEISGNAPSCNSVAEVEAACLVSIEETPEDEPVIHFSPNPVSDFLQIQIDGNDQWDISLYDLQGRLRYRQPVSGSQTVQLNDWPAGLYLLRATAGERVYAGRFVKQ